MVSAQHEFFVGDHAITTQDCGSLPSGTVVEIAGGNSRGEPYHSPTFHRWLVKPVHGVRAAVYVRPRDLEPYILEVKPVSQYIEVKASGSCAFESSTFNLRVTDDSNGAIIGEADFVESSNNWSLGDNTNPDVINVMINNSGDQARMTVTVIVVVLDEVLVDLWVTVDSEVESVEAGATSAELVVMQAVGDMKTDSV